MASRKPLVIASGLIEQLQTGDALVDAAGTGFLTPPVTYSQIQNVTADKLLGRYSTTGVIQEISIGEFSKNFLTFTDDTDWTIFVQSGPGSVAFGTMAFQNANSVDITGGTISGISDIQAVNFTADTYSFRDTVADVVVIGFTLISTTVYLNNASDAGIQSFHINCEDLILESTQGFGLAGIVWDSLNLVEVGPTDADSVMRLVKLKDDPGGTGTASLGLANSPASTLSAPYTWIEATSSDGSTIWIPAWK